MASPKKIGEALRTVEAEAAAWFSRMSSDARSSADEAEFRAWLGASPEHETAYGSLQELWADLALHEEAPEIIEAQTSAFKTSRAPPRLVIASAAAAFLAAACVAVFMWLPAQTPTYLYETGPAQNSSIALTDQSRIFLGPNTELRVRMEPGRRVVTLNQGRAFFDVTHDGSRPFTVRAADRDVRVLGTRFEVDTDAGADLMVTLVSGAVRIDRESSGAEIAHLSSNQRYVERDRVGRVENVDAAMLTSWRDGRLVFTERPLREALTELNRFLPRPIHIADRTIGEWRVSGTFRIGETTALVEALEQSFPLTSNQNSDGSITLRRR